ncbi:MAG: ribose-5-phosphate isomerase A [Candidatus Diapherotrites archaeon]|nr:ribose-5-phosphate isomerase A [Candidatus Diapherotrites archaeon]
MDTRTRKKLASKICSFIFKSNARVLAFGSTDEAFELMKAVIAKFTSKQLKQLSIIPTTYEIAEYAFNKGIRIADINRNIDLAVEFASKADKNFNFIKLKTTSLVRDKIIAFNTKELVVCCNQENMQDYVHGRILFEVVPFGWEHSLAELSRFGDAWLLENSNGIIKTENGNYLIAVDVEPIYSPEDIEYQSKKVPGVIETSLFIGLADRILLYNSKVKEIKHKAETVLTKIEL